MSDDMPTPPDTDTADPLADVEPMPMGAPERRCAKCRRTYRQSGGHCWPQPNMGPLVHCKFTDDPARPHPDTPTPGRQTPEAWAEGVGIWVMQGRFGSFAKEPAKCIGRAVQEASRQGKQSALRADLERTLRQVRLDLCRITEFEGPQDVGPLLSSSSVMAVLAKHLRALQGEATPPDKEMLDCGILKYMDEATALAAEAWPDDKPGSALSKALFAHLLEEAGELAGASRSFWGRSLRPDVCGSLADVEGEVGDVLVITLRIAATHGVDPARAIDGALAKFRRRLDKRCASTPKEEP